MNFRSLGFKLIASGLVILGVFFWVSLTILKEVENKQLLLQKYSRISAVSSTIVKVNRGIYEIQYLTSVYSNTGSSSILKKIQNRFRSLKAQAEALIEIEENEVDISSILKVMRSFGDSITSLESQFNYRKNMIDVQLKNEMLLGVEQIERHLAKTNNNRQKISFLQLNQLWMQIYIDSMNFINTKDYQSKLNVQSKIQEAKNLRKQIFKDNKKFSLKIEKLETTFNEAIQANRLYLSLVNVVMGGATHEITAISEKLLLESLEALQKIDSDGKAVFAKSRAIIYTTIGISLPLFLIVVLFIYFNVVHSLKKVTTTFSFFEKGLFDRIIPGLNRKDEIGQLARAADSFKLVSLEMNRAKKKAERLAQSKADFLANMSHEIRTPMNGIIGMVSLLQSTNVDEKQSEMLRTIESSGESLLRILNDILDHSKIEAGKLDIELRPFCLDELLKEVRFLFEERVEEKNIKLIEQRNFEEMIYLNGDNTRIKQVLINLISNAVKFTKNGHIIISTNVLDRGENIDISFSVKDTGIGIKKENIKKLFSAFSQADESITRRFGGTGLGLSISKALVELQGGKISVKSVAGEGSEFSFQLTLDRVAEINRVNNCVEMFTFDQNKRVLLVEDSKTNILVASKMLEKFHVLFDIAENGHEAVEKFKATFYDLIFMDMQMPIMDGLTATKKIRALSRGEETYIIAMTANAFTEDKEKCLKAGMDEFTSKPISLSKISELLIKYKKAA
jgi:signal transduction histidine kinase/ActR/RegA family two-component response regulator